jgi:hypothetical protein
MMRYLHLLLATFALPYVLTAAPKYQADYPDFSWETVPVYIHFGDANGYTDEAIEFIASHSSFVCMEKMQGGKKHGSVEKGQEFDAVRLKATNPNLKILFYWNTFLDYSGYDAHEVYQQHPEWWLRKQDGELDKKGGNLKRYDLSNPEVRDWWTDVVKEAVANGHCDGVFMDAFPQITSPANVKLWGQRKFDEIQEGLFETIALTREKMGPGGIVMYNGIRNTDKVNLGMQFLDVADAATIEHFGHFFSNSPESMAQDIEDMIEAGKMGKIVVMKGWPGFSWIDKGIRQRPHEVNLELARKNITFPLACFLVAAQKYSYFCYTWGYQQTDGSTDWYPELDKPLGNPKGDAIRDGFKYSREFEHCSVWVDLEKKTAKIDWK